MLFHAGIVAAFLMRIAQVRCLRAEDRPCERHARARPERVQRPEHAASPNARAQHDPSRWYRWNVDLSQPAGANTSVDLCETVSECAVQMFYNALRKKEKADGIKEEDIPVWSPSRSLHGPTRVRITM